VRRVKYGSILLSRVYGLLALNRVCGTLVISMCVLLLKSGTQRANAYRIYGLLAVRNLKQKMTLIVVNHAVTYVVH